MKILATRPELNLKLSPEDFRNYYWLKSELISFCRTHELVGNGGKEELAARIEHYLITGEYIDLPKRKKSISTFDWKTEILQLHTLITDNYQNTENVRAFFKQHIGATFSFNVLFMDWMKKNTGKTLADAIEEWKRIRQLKKDPSYRTEISRQFEYNTYIRDFMDNNPSLGIKAAIHCWNKKRVTKGSKKYSSSDIDFLS